VNRLANKRATPVRGGCAHCAPRFVKKFFFLFCSDKFLFNGFWARHNLGKSCGGRRHTQNRGSDRTDRPSAHSHEACHAGRFACHEPRHARKFLPGIRSLARCEEGCRDPSAERMSFVEAHQASFASHGARASAPPPQQGVACIECCCARGRGRQCQPPAMTRTRPVNLRPLGRRGAARWGWRFRRAHQEGALLSRRPHRDALDRAHRLAQAQ
jgi:hypothetical protein